MLILIHVLIALSSVGLTTYAFFAPSKTKLHASYALVGATLASGTVLVASNPVHITQACTTGLFYVGVMTVSLVAVHHKLAQQKTRQ